MYEMCLLLPSLFLHPPRPQTSETTWDLPPALKQQQQQQPQHYPQQQQQQQQQASYPAQAQQAATYSAQPTAGAAQPTNSASFNDDGDPGSRSRQRRRLEAQLMSGGVQIDDAIQG